MKKTYLKPTMRVFNISASNILAGSILQANDQDDPFMESPFYD